MDVKIEESWKAVLREEFDKEYFSRIAAFLHQEKREGKTIYPPGPLIFNAFRLTSNDIGTPAPASGNLERWARQGVFLLNSVLTVRAGAPTSHSNIGWQTFTDAVIKTISDKKDGLVFMLWGNYARSKRLLIDNSRHLVLEAWPGEPSSDAGISPKPTNI